MTHCRSLRCNVLSYDILFLSHRTALLDTHINDELFYQFMFDQIHHFTKNIHNVNDGHLAKIIQLKCAHT
jgi:hypothetical protein